MKKLVSSLLAFVAALLFIPGLTAHAESLHYTISANLPNNQLDTSASYFDLLVKPGSTQNLSIVITNSDSKAHNYSVATNRSETNTNGVIDYNKHNKTKPASLQANIEDMMPAPTKVKVPAKSAKTVTMKLSVPTKSFTGVVLGGIRVEELDTTSTAKKSKGLTLTNKFAYVLGLQLRETKNVSNIKPDMRLNKVGATQINNRNYISAYLENTQPTMMTTVRVKAKVYKDGSNDVFVKTDKSDMKMAPNSVFAFPINANEYPLEAGNYKLVGDAWAENGKYHWHFSKSFVITGAEANKLNKTAVDQKKPKTNWLMYILIALAILIFLILLLIIILLLKRRKKDDDEDNAKK
ncbi:DUF916 and DUF3324 domain-containing protein [Lacticaseibacillus sharpeae]|uniref:Cell surface protein n=1 Tax=Lacticaseibacillus sharpeae JCM 1186 = DSM 20505 TaxID=1291052 RepID=A0A0R1ZVL5_9LACO|nr:DUF916 and DUF3324 domain-containing protein [Lacticaseibacillus sharpeae]KRM55833.1 cell surface protein [Lacticaseibacillus sharpeae JCM 1186 = DSM 20505]